VVEVKGPPWKLPPIRSNLLNAEPGVDLYPIYDVMCLRIICRIARPCSATGS
jgi:hypothetical protein